MSLLNHVYSPPASAFIHPHSTLICLKGLSENHQAHIHWLQEAPDAYAAHAAQPSEITKAKRRKKSSFVCKVSFIGVGRGKKPERSEKLRQGTLINWE